MPSHNIIERIKSQVVRARRKGTFRTQTALGNGMLRGRVQQAATELRVRASQFSPGQRLKKKVSSFSSQKAETVLLPDIRGRLKEIEI